MTFRRIRAAFVPLFLIGSLATVPASADAHCNVDAGSDAAPHLEDMTNDWEGVVGGNGTALVPYGDVYMGATDLIAGWLNRTGDVYTANIQTVMLSGLETNAIYYFLWTFEGGDPLRARRWVSAQILRPLPTPIYQFRYGHIEPGDPVDNLVQDGSTTGTITPGTPGKVSVVIPMNRMGSPGPGASLDSVLAEARVLLGAAQTGGLVGVADMTDGFPCASVTIP